VIKGKDGKMTTDAEKVKSRWNDYFEGLCNDPNPVNEATLSQIAIRIRVNEYWWKKLPEP